MIVMTKKKFKPLKNHLPTIFNKRKTNCHKRPIIQCKQFDYPASAIASCRVVKFVKPQEWIM